MENICLQPEDREFFSYVTKAAFSNPFSEKRKKLDREIAGLLTEIPLEELLDEALARVRKKIRSFDKEKKARLKNFSGQDREIMKYAYLFDVFHQFMGLFDESIEAQVRRGDNICPVPFAGHALAMLLDRGFTKEQSHLFFAFFFQMRRAYYFIDKRIIGRSSSMKQLRCALWNNVFTKNRLSYEKFLWNRMEDFSTLFLGETGTGKGTAALAIGRSGFIPFDNRSNCFVESFTRSFVSTNLSEFPETLIESELFGHKKGAFTGAIESHTGLFDRCSPHGAIFLDEIGDISVPVQIKLLQVLQERTYSPVGSYEKRRFSGRVIAATNKSLDKLRREGTFRDDFFYRLCSDIIEVPSLRQRVAEDAAELDDLVIHSLEKITGQKNTEDAQNILGIIRKNLPAGYPWPGNVRELEQCIRRILLKGSYKGAEIILGTDVSGRLLHDIETGSLDASGLLSRYCLLLHQRHGTYEDVARITGLDRRTAKKYVIMGLSRFRSER